MRWLCSFLRRRSARGAGDVHTLTRLPQTKATRPPMCEPQGLPPLPPEFTAREAAPPYGAPDHHEVRVHDWLRRWMEGR
ncbi:hypothetical protein [Streptomyces buecherae]|uniref:Uncharacterized protein n=1 Tax=Streptomyces buecherae TaxID=2763006 RepID=A0A7H8NKG4_9ACTN|nr:hypothetical protein [Streptomyces buecherae]QKW55041.1 hypothetical protein HUT08_36540 [Streptomyces buecherae]